MQNLWDIPRGRSVSEEKDRFLELRDIKLSFLTMWAHCLIPLAQPLTRVTMEASTCAHVFISQNFQPMSTELGLDWRDVLSLHGEVLTCGREVNWIHLWSYRSPGPLRDWAKEALTFELTQFKRAWHSCEVKPSWIPARCNFQRKRRAHVFFFFFFFSTVAHCAAPGRTVPLISRVFWAVAGHIITQRLPRISWSIFDF